MSTVNPLGGTIPQGAPGVAADLDVHTWTFDSTGPGLTKNPAGKASWTHQLVVTGDPLASATVLLEGTTDLTGGTGWQMIVELTAQPGYPASVPAAIHAWPRLRATCTAMLPGTTLATFTSSGAFLAEPEWRKLGDIQYFAEQPDDLRWVKCDGKTHLRSAYPLYAPLRPDPAFQVTLEEVEMYLWGASCMLPDGTAIVSDGSALVQFDTATGVVTPLVIGGPMADYATPVRLSTGRILVVCNGAQAFWSDDLETWTEEEPPLAFGAYGHTYQWSNIGATFYFPIPGERKMLYTTDGETWGVYDFSTVETGGWAGSHRYSVLPYKPVPVSMSGYGGAQAIVFFNGPLTGFMWADPAYIAPEASDIPVREGFFPAVTDTTVYAATSGSVMKIPRDKLNAGQNLLCVGPGVPRVCGLVAGRFLGLAVSNDELLMYWESDGVVEGCSITEVFGLTGVAVDQSATPVMLSGPANSWAFNELNGAPGSGGLLKFTTDATRFHAPGLAPVGGAHPYVWTGA